jgi:hypothetical protein
MPAGALKDQPAAGREATVYVKLVPNRDGFHEAVSVYTAPVNVAAPEVLIRGHVTTGANCGPDSRAFCGNLQVRYGLERYFGWRRLRNCLVAEHHLLSVARRVRFDVCVLMQPPPRPLSITRCLPRKRYARLRAPCSLLASPNRRQDA